MSERTSTINRLRMRVHELDPFRLRPWGRCIAPSPMSVFAGWLATQPGVLAELARDEFADITRLTEADALAKPTNADRIS